MSIGQESMHMAVRGRLLGLRADKPGLVGDVNNVMASEACTDREDPHIR